MPSLKLATMKIQVQLHSYYEKMVTIISLQKFVSTIQKNVTIQRVFLTGQMNECPGFLGDFHGIYLI